MAAVGMHFLSILVLRFVYSITKIRYEAFKGLISRLIETYVGRLQLSAFLLMTSVLAPCPAKTMIDVCPNENVTFWLYNEKLKEPYQFNLNDTHSIKKAPLISKAPVKILMHGYGGHKDDGPNPQIRPSYVISGYNVITADYQPVVRKPCYLQAVANTDTVSRCIADFIEALLQNKKVKKKWVHVVAFSLGTHIAVSTGRRLIARGIKLPRVTVLDAAAPMFYVANRFTKPRCAKFVDAVHTNVGIYGKTAKVGDVDFYANFLFFQEGCSITDVSCNHAKAPEYFGESILTTVGFWGYPIEGQTHMQLMGEYTPHDATGSYYIATNKVAPYATGTTIPNTIIKIRNQTWDMILDMYECGEALLRVVGHFRMFTVLVEVLKKLWWGLRRILEHFWGVSQLSERLEGS